MFSAIKFEENMEQWKDLKGKQRESPEAGSLEGQLREIVLSREEKSGGTSNNHLQKHKGNCEEAANRLISLSNVEKKKRKKSQWKSEKSLGRFFQWESCLSRGTDCPGHRCGISATEMAGSRLDRCFPGKRQILPLDDRQSSPLCSPWFLWMPKAFPASRQCTGKSQKLSFQWLLVVCYPLKPDSNPYSCTLPQVYELLGVSLPLVWTSSFTVTSQCSWGPNVPEKYISIWLWTSLRK